MGPGASLDYMGQVWAQFFCGYSLTAFLMLVNLLSPLNIQEFDISVKERKFHFLSNRESKCYKNSSPVPA